MHHDLPWPCFLLHRKAMWARKMRTYVMKHHGTSWNIMEHHEIWPLFILWLLVTSVFVFEELADPQSSESSEEIYYLDRKFAHQNAGTETPCRFYHTSDRNTWWFAKYSGHEHMNVKPCEKKTALRCSNVSWISLEPCLDRSLVFISLLIGPMMAHCFPASVFNPTSDANRLVVGMCDLPAILHQSLITWCTGIGFW